MSNAVEFWVSGTPAPEGSVTAFPVKDAATGRTRAVVTHSNKKGLRSWRGDVREAWQRHVGEWDRDAAIHVTILFVMETPKTVRRPYPSVRPDLDKLARAVLDALTGLAYRDDGQVVSLAVTKSYGTAPGATIKVRCL